MVFIHLKNAHHHEGKPTKCLKQKVQTGIRLLTSLNKMGLEKDKREGKREEYMGKDQLCVQTAYSAPANPCSVDTWTQWAPFFSVIFSNRTLRSTYLHTIPCYLIQNTHECVSNQLSFLRRNKVCEAEKKRFTTSNMN